MASEIIVVGGGVVGLGCAIEARLAGFSVSLIESHQVGGGATSGAMGTITPFSDHEASLETVALASRSAARLERFLGEAKSALGKDSKFRKRGTLELFFEAREYETIKERLDSLRGIDPNISVNDARRTHELQAGLNPSLIGSIFYPNEPELSIPDLVSILEAYAWHIGCSIIQNSAVTKVQSTGSGVTVAHPGGALKGDFAVIAAGLRHNHISGLRPIPLRPVTGEVVLARAIGVDIPNNLYYGRGFIAPKADSLVLLGSNYEEHIAGMDDNTSSISAASMIDTLLAARRILPFSGSFQVCRVWKHWRPTTIDHHPVLDAPDNGRIIYANGLYGLGVTLTFGFADLIINFLRTGCRNVFPERYWITRFDQMR